MKILHFFLDLLWLVMTRRLILIVFVILLFVAFRFDVTSFFWPREGKKNLAPSSRMVEESAGEVARSIVLQCPQPEKTFSRLLILPVRGDRENAIETMIRKEFQQQAGSGWFTLVEKDIVTQKLDQLQLLAFGRDGQKELTKDDAIRIGKAADAELVLLSQVDRFVPGSHGHEIRGTAQLINVQTGNASPLPFDNTAGRSMMKYGMGWSQFAGLVLFTLLWPILMVPVLRNIVARENNRDNFAAMIVMAAIPLVIALLLVGALPTSAFALICCCVFFALAAGWTAFVMDKIAEK